MQSDTSPADWDDGPKADPGDDNVIINRHVRRHEKALLRRAEKKRRR